jgi:hypothetical protein
MQPDGMPAWQAVEESSRAPIFVIPAPHQVWGGLRRESRDSRRLKIAADAGMNFES